MPKFDAKQFDGLPVEEVLQRASEAVAAGRDALQEARSIYDLCLSQSIDIYTRGTIRQRLWKVEQNLGIHPLFFSQAGQDRFIYETFFKGKKNGVFVEIGGYNGWEGSNCFFFETTQNWTGLIVEASPRMVRKIGQFRIGEVIHAAICDYDGTAEFIEVTSGFTQMGGLAKYYVPEILNVVRNSPRHEERNVKVPSMRLDSLLNKYDLKHVDYCSIDVEGAERSILTGFDFNAFDISVLSVENTTKSKSMSFQDILEPAGYRLVDVIGGDEIYQK